MPTHHILEVTTVNVEDPADLALWALVIEADPAEVAMAAQQVGIDPEAIRQYLSKPDSGSRRRSPDATPSS